MRYPFIVELMMLDSLAAALWHGSEKARGYATAVKNLTTQPEIERAITRYLADPTQTKQLLEVIETRMLAIDED
jgi:hypothetical protein